MIELDPMTPLDGARGCATPDSLTSLLLRIPFFFPARHVGPDCGAIAPATRLLMLRTLAAPDRDDGN